MGEEAERFAQIIRQHSVVTKLVFVFVHTNGHWTLLSLWFSNQKLKKAQYMDSLNSPSASCRATAEVALKFYDSTTVLPEVSNRSYQKEPSCGWFVLSFVDLIYKEF